MGYVHFCECLVRLAHELCPHWAKDDPKRLSFVPEVYMCRYLCVCVCVCVCMCVCLGKGRSGFCGFMHVMFSAVGLELGVQLAVTNTHYIYIYIHIIGCDEHTYNWQRELAEPTNKWPIDNWPID